MAKLNKKTTVVGLVVIVILLAGYGVYRGHKDYLWFTPAYSQKQALQSFFSDLSKGKTQQAYAMLSSSSSYTYAEFQSNYDALEGNNIKVDYQSWSTKNNITAFSGAVTIGKTKTKLDFLAGVTKTSTGYKLASLQSLYYK